MGERGEGGRWEAADCDAGARWALTLTRGGAWGGWSGWGGGVKARRAGGCTAAEAKLQQGQNVFALEHMVKAGSSLRGMRVPDGPS